VIEVEKSNGNLAFGPLKAPQKPAETNGVKAAFDSSFNDPQVI
jgi:hypothetical protein